MTKGTIIKTLRKAKKPDLQSSKPSFFYCFFAEKERLYKPLFSEFVFHKFYQVFRSVPCSGFPAFDCSL